VAGTVVTLAAAAAFGANVGVTVGALAIAHAALVAVEVGLIAGGLGAAGWWLWPEEQPAAAAGS
jgi:hypothetical protein